jgi:hypothetical protein
MTVSDKDFVLKNGLTVYGTASFNSNILINNTPITINVDTKRLQAYINNRWVEMAFQSDIGTVNLSLMNLNVNYGGASGGN